MKCKVYRDLNLRRWSEYGSHMLNRSESIWRAQINYIWKHPLISTWKEGFKFNSFWESALQKKKKKKKKKKKRGNENSYKLPLNSWPLLRWLSEWNKQTYNIHCISPKVWKIYRYIFTITSRSTLWQICCILYHNWSCTVDWIAHFLFIKGGHWKCMKHDK